MPRAQTSTAPTAVCAAQGPRSPHRAHTLLRPAPGSKCCLPDCAASRSGPPTPPSARRNRDGRRRQSGPAASRPPRGGSAGWPLHCPGQVPGVWLVLKKAWGVRFRWMECYPHARARVVAGLSAFWLMSLAPWGSPEQANARCPGRAQPERWTYAQGHGPATAFRGETPEEVHKTVAIAAAGALLLIGGVTAAANAGTVPVASAPVAAPGGGSRRRCPAGS